MNQNQMNFRVSPESDRSGTQRLFSKEVINDGDSVYGGERN